MTVAHDSPAAPATALDRYSSILVGVRGGPADDRVVAAAVALAAPDATLTLLSCARAAHWPLLELAYAVGLDPYRARDEAAAALHRAVAHVPATFAVRSLVATGSLGPALGEQADGGAYDIVVAAASACRGLARSCAAPVLAVPVITPQHRRKVFR